ALFWGAFPLLLLVLALVMAARDLGFRDHLKTLSLRERGLSSTQWLDMYTADDPVPNGPLSRPGATVRGLISRAIVNRRSLLFDPTSYWANRVVFIPRVVARIERHARLGLFDGASGWRALRHIIVCGRRHEARVRWLVVSRWISVISAILAVVA